MTYNPTIDGQPDCSVIIATHQRLAMLREALQSALAQRNVRIEVIVVANGCTDGTREFLESVTDPRLQALVYDQPLGATAARNEGLRHARGRWLGFLDDDDLWAPDKLRTQVDHAQAARRDWAYTGCVFIDAQCEVIGGLPPPAPDDVAQRLPQRYVIPAGISGMLWRAGALDGDGLLAPELTYMVDWDLSQRLLRHGPPAVVAVPLVAYRQHGANMSVRAHSYLSELEVIGPKFTGLRKGRPLDVAYQHRNAGSEFLRAGLRGEALRCYWRAARMGDRGAIVRAGAALVPQRVWPMLRRKVLSDTPWRDQAEVWLKHHRASPVHRARSARPVSSAAAA